MGQLILVIDADFISRMTFAVNWVHMVSGHNIEREKNVNSRHEVGGVGGDFC